MCSPYWNVLGDQILYFLKFFYYSLSHFENHWSNSFTIWLSHRWINDFQSGLINSKQIQKNVKFGLQAHFNMKNTSNGLDRLFELRKLKNKLVVFRQKCNQFIFQFLKSKKSIQTVRCVLHIEMCLETKFYIFWNFFTIY